MPDLDRTSTYQQVLDTAEHIARERGDTYVCAEHLLLAYLSDPLLIGNGELRHRMRKPDPDELARRVRNWLDEPKPGEDEHGVRSLDGSGLVRRNSDLSTVTSWSAPGRS